VDVYITEVVKERKEAEQKEKPGTEEQNG